MAELANAVSTFGASAREGRFADHNFARRRQLRTTLAIPLAVALLVALMSHWGVLVVPNGLFYDAVTLREASPKPKVIVIENDGAAESYGALYASIAQVAINNRISRVAFPFDPGFTARDVGVDPAKIVIGRPIDHIPGKQAMRLRGGVSDPAALQSAVVLARSDYGIHRRQLGWLSGESGTIPAFESVAAGRRPNAQSYLVRWSHHQALPRVAASQLLAGQIDGRSLEGLIALVAPPPGTQPHMLTPAGGDTQIDEIEFRAAAIQTLLDQREVTPFGNLAMLAILTAFAAAISLLLAFADPKRTVLPILVPAIVVIPLVAGAALTWTGLLLPVAELVLMALLSAPLVLQHAELREDMHLRRLVTRLVNFSIRHSFPNAESRLPEFLTDSARTLGVAHMLLLRHTGRGRFEIMAAHDADLSDLVPDRKLRRAAMAQAGKADWPIEAAALAPSWQGAIRLARIAAGDERIYWLYALKPGADLQASEALAESLAVGYRDFRLWRHQLSAQDENLRGGRLAEDWVGSAVAHIAHQGEQVRSGIEGLGTGIIIFHMIGMPVQSNHAANKLCTAAGLSLTEATLADVIAGLTGMESARITAALRDIMLHGGEIRAHCREFVGKAHVLRVAASSVGNHDGDRAIILETTDVTELKQLSDLRMRVAHVLDNQLRNDLEAINLAARIANDPRIDNAKSGILTGQMVRVTQRMIGRLQDLSPHLRAEDSKLLTEAYPIDTRSVISDALEMARPLALELGVAINSQIPEISGFSVAMPGTLSSMVNAMLQIVISDTPHGEAVDLTVNEEIQKTQVTISGGIGIPFERLYALLDTPKVQSTEPYRSIVSGIADALGWGAMVTYSSHVGKGYRFMINMRRIA